MTTLRTLKKLVFGETWLLPAGIAIIIAAADLLARPALATVWPQLGGFLMLAGVLVVLVTSVARAGRRRGSTFDRDTASGMLARSISAPRRPPHPGRVKVLEDDGCAGCGDVVQLEPHSFRDRA